MKPCSYSFPISLGEKATDSLSGFSGTVVGFNVYSDGTTGVALTTLGADGTIKTEWIQTSRLNGAAVIKEPPKSGPKPAAAAPAPAQPAAAPAPDKLTPAREVLKKVLDTKGANEVRDILSRVGATKLSEVKDDALLDKLMGFANAALGGTPAAAPVANTSMFD